MGLEVNRGRDHDPKLPAPRSTPESRALGLSPDSAGGAAVPIQLDGKKVRQPTTGGWEDTQTGQAAYGHTGKTERDA